MELAELYKQIFSSCVKFAVFREKNVEKDIRNILPELEGFSNIILQGSIQGITKSENQVLQLQLKDILQDTVQGLEQKDHVLLEDTLEYGWKTFLELFFEEDELIKLREETTNE